MLVKKANQTSFQNLQYKKWSVHNGCTVNVRKQVFKVIHAPRDISIVALGFYCGAILLEEAFVVKQQRDLGFSVYDEGGLLAIWLWSWAI